LKERGKVTAGKDGEGVEGKKKGEERREGSRGRGEKRK
jgi:hypothetical protein